MNKNVKNALKLAVLTGFMAGAATKALADDKAKMATDADADKAKAEKSGCAGKDGCSGDCKGKAKKAHGKKHHKGDKAEKMADKQTGDAPAEATLPPTDAVKK